MTKINGQKIKETTKELNRCSPDTSFFTLNDEIHLAKVVKCYDGDSVHCIFKHNKKYFKFNIRMYGYDSPEMRLSTKIPTKERNAMKEKAVLAKKRLEELVLNKCVYLYCMKFDKYGRLLGTIKLNNNDKKTVNDIMVEEGHGYPYYGGTKKTN